MKQIVYWRGRNVTDLPTNAYISVNSCGFTRHGCNEPGYAVIREEGRHDWLFLYVLSGCCRIEKCNRETILSGGHGVLFRPGEKQVYLHEEKQEILSFWLHIAGTGMEKIVAGLPLTDDYFSSPPTYEVSSLLSRLCRAYAAGQEKDGLLLTGLALEALYFLCRGEHTQIDDLRLIPAIMQMHESYSSSLSVAAYAALCQLSEGRFSHLFRDNVGMSPHAYLMKLRLEHASELLASTSLSIGQIACSVGYDDPLYFSRLFKKKTGVSPQAFRKVP